MEMQLLSTINFALGHPTAETFLKAYLIPNLQNASVETRCVARYLLELTLVHETFLHFPPSTISKACLVCADEMSRDLSYYRTSQSVSICKSALLSVLNDPPAPIFNKYGGADFCFASHIVKRRLEHRYIFFMCASFSR